MSVDLEVIKDEKFQAYVINKKIPFPIMLEKAGYEDYSYDGKCYCPFHDNYESPAGKIYHDKEGDTLWCFSEQKRYYPADVLRKNLMKGKSVASIFSNLWGKLSEDTRQALYDNYDKPIDMLPEMWVNNRAKLDLFKQGTIDINQHLYLVRQCLS